MHSDSHEQEGVIKFHLVYSHRCIDFSGLSDAIEQLNLARSVMKAHALIGQDPLRYGGDGFGNISVRVENSMFLISATQTGHLERLTEMDVALVEDFDYPSNQLSASGMSKPSSESMTHGVAYQALNGINAVIHVHSPEIWTNSERLGLAATAANIPYGTPQMAEAVRQLLLVESQKTGFASQLNEQAIVFAMKGHEDGVVAVGASLASCVETLIDSLACARSR